MTEVKIPSHLLTCPVVFVSTASGQRRDIMTATMPLHRPREPPET